MRVGAFHYLLKFSIHHTFFIYDNKKTVAFQNLNLDIYDMNGAHIGEVNRKERMRVNARSSAIMQAKATLQPSIIEIFAMGLDCIQNDNLTK